MIKTRILNCGSRVVMERIPYVQSVAVGIWAKAGSVDEPTDLLGMSHYIEHMLFKGTESRNAKKIAEDIDKIGAQINAFTSKESTCYYVKSLSSNIEQALDVLVDMFINSKFDEIEMEKEKNVVFEEINMVEDSPEDDIHDSLYEVLFKGGPLATPILGTKKTVKSFSRDKIMAYIQQEYTRDNLVIAVAGNFDENSVCDYFEGKLIALKPSKETKNTIVPLYTPHFKNKIKDIEQSHICLGTKGLQLNDERYFAMSLLNNIMGGSMSSRLFQNIREEKGMAYSVYSYTSSYTNDGFFGIYAGVSHEMIEPAVQSIVEELNLLKARSVTKEELSTAKEQLKGNYIFGQESVSGRMAAIGKNILLIGKIHSPEEVIKKIDAVTMDDIKDVSDKITAIDQYSGVLLSREKKDLKKILLNAR
jgi:predicted Zn-dependent peptidase